jgi:dipeptidyl aminopeptidase/acylaminoacyl peptidase
MKRALAVLAVLAALAIAIAASASHGSSPHGGVAYETGRHGALPRVWLADADGKNRHQLGPGNHPSLSPNGLIVAAASDRQSGRALTLYSDDGSKIADFFDASQQTASAASWSPDSRYLAVVLSSTDPGSNSASGLAVIDTKTNSTRLLARGSIYGASFAPDRSQRIAYALAPTQALFAPIDIHVTGVDGSSPTTLTQDGRSLYPVWGRVALAFDRERLRRRAAPAYQVWLMRADGTSRRQLASVHAPALANGLLPLAFSADGSRLLAEYEGANISRAWAIDTSTGAAAELRHDGHTVTGAAISRDGTRLLVDRGGYLNPPDSGRVETIPFGGGTARALIDRGANPSWNL